MMQAVHDAPLAAAHVLPQALPTFNRSSLVRSFGSFTVGFFIKLAIVDALRCTHAAGAGASVCCVLLKAPQPDRMCCLTTQGCNCHGRVQRLNASKRH